MGKDTFCHFVMLTDFMIDVAEPSFRQLLRCRIKLGTGFYRSENGKWLTNFNIKNINIYLYKKTGIIKTQLITGGRGQGGFLLF